MTASPNDIAVSVSGLRIAYGKVDVVKGIDLSVRSGEIVSLLGPSGCGKTTTLRAIAGFASPASGSIALHGRDVTDVPPNKRNIGLVFQGYALFPHLTVFENVAYGLRTRRRPRDEIERRVRGALSLVKLDHLADRRPRQLSGGQQQRVAIARALVIEPAVLLLDEPLSNLDAKLRHEMRVELRRLLLEMKIASIFVTHDQEEAIVLSDRIILMNEGRAEQQGTPREMYQRPASLFASAFLGQANFLRGTTVAAHADGTVEIDIGGERFRGLAGGRLEAGQPATMVVKFERVRLAEGESGLGNGAACRFDMAHFLGANLQLQCDFKGQRLVGLLPASVEAAHPFERDGALMLGWKVEDALVFPNEG